MLPSTHLDLARTKMLPLLVSNIRELGLAKLVSSELLIDSEMEATIIRQEILPKDIPHKCRFSSVKEKLIIRSRVRLLINKIIN
jgi:hypothetical protein